MPSAGWAAHGLNYQVSAVDPKIIRIRIGSGGLPEDASWAVLQKARVALPCGSAPTGAGQLFLNTSALNVAVNGGASLITVSDIAGDVLWQDAASPVFNNTTGSLAFSGVIPPDSHFYGLGDKSDSIDKMGNSYTNWNTDHGDPYGDPIYKSIPFFIRKVGSTYTGYFLDNTWKTTFDFGKTSPGILAMTAAGGGIDYYVIAGDTPKEVLANYAKLTGATPLPNLWALGWQQSHETYTHEQAEYVAHTYRSDNIPADVIWLDIGYQNNNYTFTVGKDYGSSLAPFIQDMTNINFKVVPIVDYFIPQQKNGSYAPYTQGHADNYFIKGSNGQEYASNGWPTDVPSVYPDFTNGDVLTWWGGLFNEFYVTDNASGFWNDMNEPTPCCNGSPHGNIPMPTTNTDVINGSGFKYRVANAGGNPQCIRYGERPRHL